MGAPVARVKAEFANRLQERIARRGWNQSELARQASLHLPEGQKVSRDNISNYIRGKHLPGPAILNALALALRVEPDALLPPRAVPSADDAAPPLDVKDLGDGSVYLRVNQRVPWAVALKVLNTMKGGQE